MTQTIVEPAIDEQAEELAQRTQVTEAQAQVYLYNKRADDDTPQRQLAADLDISPSTFSKHLNAAKDVFGKSDDDEAAIEALSRFVLTSWAGGANSDMRKVRAGTHSNSATAIITEYAFDNVGESGNYKYRLHMYLRNTPNGEYMDNMPEDMHLPARGTHLTVGAHTLTKLSEYASAMLENEGMTGFDQAGIMLMFKKEGVDITEWEESVL